MSGDSKLIVTFYMLPQAIVVVKETKQSALSQYISNENECAIMYNVHGDWPIVDEENGIGLMRSESLGAASRQIYLFSWVVLNNTNYFFCGFFL